MGAIHIKSQGSLRLSSISLLTDSWEARVLGPAKPSPRDSRVLILGTPSVEGKPGRETGRSTRLVGKYLRAVSTCGKTQHVC
jgi:hypothetical protein